MTLLQRIVMVRHGETVGESSVRYYGATDIALSDLGRAQVRAAARRLPGDAFDLVVSSPLSRAWESATLVAPGRPVRLDPDLREVDFGLWEGLTAPEIEARDPVRYQDWTRKRPGFDYPDGERRVDFQARVARAVDAMLADRVASVLAVAHKGVIRTMVRKLTGEEPTEGLPPLGGVLQLSRGARGSWFLGRRSSGPDATDARQR
jgi:broad specificity phosphatase PhoE